MPDTLVEHCFSHKFKEGQLSQATNNKYDKKRIIKQPITKNQKMNNQNKKLSQATNKTITTNNQKMNNQNKNISQATN